MYRKWSSDWLKIMLGLFFIFCTNDSLILMSGWPSCLLISPVMSAHPHDRWVIWHYVDWVRQAWRGKGHSDTQSLCLTSMQTFTCLRHIWGHAGGRAVFFLTLFLWKPCVVSVLNGICVLLYGAATYCYLTFFIFICTCDVSEYCNLLHLYI